MNKDQKLLEEAYQSICESALEPLYFGSEKDKKPLMKWLRKWTKYEVHEDGSISVKGNVNLGGLGLKRIPFNFREVSEHFACYDNELTSLEGAPKVVGESFDCSKNRLASLKGSPEKIEGNFHCPFNKLTSLEGAPKVVKGSFYCHKNKLVSLEGAPEEIEDEFVSDKFSDEDYRAFVKKRKFVDKKLSPELNIDLEDFS